MRYGIALLAAAVFAVTIGTQCANAVGYEPCDRSGLPTRSQQGSGNSRGIATSIQKASFLDKCPQVIEGVADSVRGILSQFGVVNLKTP